MISPDFGLSRPMRPLPEFTNQMMPSLTTLHQRPESPRPPQEPRRRAIDVGAVITRALTAAGLMK